MARNWRDHASELGNETPPPQFFFKPNTSVIGPGDPIALPEWSDNVSFEGELAVVIGRIAKSVPLDRVPEVIYGFTVANDLTARDAQKPTSSGPVPRASTVPAPWPLDRNRPGYRRPHHPNLG